MKLILILVFIPFFLFAAEPMKSGVIEKCGIELLVLNSWQPQDPTNLKPPVCFEMTLRKEASVAILASSDSRLTCAEFLKNMDDSRKKKNQLKPENQKISTVQLKNANADDGALGEYEVSEPKMKYAVKQKSYCFKKANETRVILATYQKNKGAQYEPLIAEIVSTFKFSKSK